MMTQENTTTTPASISQDQWDRLFDAAIEAQQHAHAPYSKFPVGAALLTTDGQIISGCNMENATFGATVCAERTAFGCAIAQGHRGFAALCVVTNLDHPAAPCGICRQVFAEFCKELPIMVANPQRDCFFTSLSELLPHRFSEADLAVIK